VGRANSIESLCPLKCIFAHRQPKFQWPEEGFGGVFTLVVWILLSLPSVSSRALVPAKHIESYDRFKAKFMEEKAEQTSVSLLIWWWLVHKRLMEEGGRARLYISKSAKDVD